MPLIIPAGYAQMVIEMRLGDDPEPMVTTMGITVDPLDVPDTLAQAMFQTWTQKLSGQIATTYATTGVTLYVGTGASTPPTVHESSGAEVLGQATAAPLPQNCALLVRKRTSAGGRRGRGRMYIPGVSEIQVTAQGGILAAAVTGWQTAFTNWFNALVAPASGPPHIPVILHRSEGIGVEPAPTTISALVVDSRIATQRRRLRP